MIFDTDALIWLGRGDVRVRDVFEADHSPAISLVTMIELFQGSRSAAELAATRGFVRKFGLRLFPVTEGISYRAVALIEKHTPGDGLQLGDSLVAATAIEHDETLIKGNVRHFRKIGGLKIKGLRHS